MLVGHLAKFGFFLGSSVVSGLLNLLAVVSDRIARVFNRSRARRTAVLDIFKDFDMVRHTGLLHKLNESSVLVFVHISSFLSNRRL